MEELLAEADADATYESAVREHVEHGGLLRVLAN